MASSGSNGIPSSILIIGSGAFGLSTAWALCKNPLFKDTAITLVDRQPFPAPDGSSIDTSRIIRPDYASRPYARLAARAQTLWRTTFAPTHYHETGLAVTASGPEQTYVSDSLANVRSLGNCEVEVLPTPADIARVTGMHNAHGSVGYVNWTSGWADAEGSMRWLRAEVESQRRVEFVTARVSRLAIDHAARRVTGARLDDGRHLAAGLTVLAAGAWTPSLLDLRGICKPTGQALVYLPITDAEQAALEGRPTLLNLSSGLFVIPPARNLLKLARHGHGYTNPTTIPHPESPDPLATLTTSLPYTAVDDPAQAVPREAQAACRDFLTLIHPALSSPDRPFSATKICWYNDTRDGDFLIDYHPAYRGLFVATGGSGHGFKFLPVIGECIVECVLGRMPEDFRGKWEWPRERVPEENWAGDGSRGGPEGMVLSEETGKGASKL